ncbi:hypothetical protein [uncultured Aquimarina sp.]|uniref:hypothetical protein n=1 Tax=uncultured Aquimarina sp. TaxID=575652 RepID=UPI002622FB30|nr:hypothetical protein [uncultured Aquimarina sp.]
MKKITLLLVAAVFAIGIQSCSTEKEFVYQGDKIPEDAIKFTNNIGQKNLNGNATTPFKKLLVYYPDGASFEDNMDYVESSLKTTFSTIFVGVQQQCGTIYEWYVPIDELPDYYCRRSCAPEDSYPKLDGEGTATHKKESKLVLSGDDEEGDAACPGCKSQSSYGWINHPNPTCEDIESYYNYL